MSLPAPADRGPVVVDTSILGAGLADRFAPLAVAYAPLVEGRPVFASFVTEAEMRFGARNASWGMARLRRLEVLVSSVRVVWPDPTLVEAYVDLRAWCQRTGHGLAGKDHEADRWIAATARWLGLPLVTHDRIFLGVDGLEVLTRLDA